MCVCFILFCFGYCVILGYCVLDLDILHASKETWVALGKPVFLAHSPPIGLLVLALLFLPIDLGCKIKRLNL